jgi:hypothetical protein|tara:strand:- start:192 stop:392 length:201 start_codon:yes stop_codon:yes gene_type:complete
MKNYINLFLGIILVISAVKPLFYSNENRAYDVLGLELNKYVYVFLHLILGCVLIATFLKKKRMKGK